MLQLIAIKTKDKIFVSADVENQGIYAAQYSDLTRFKFDGEIPVRTYKNNWFSAKQIPEKIEKIIPPKRINDRWELKEGFPVTVKTPEVLEYKYNSDKDYGSACFPDEYSEFEAIYEHKHEWSEETYEQVEFQINVIAELEQFEIVKEEFKLKYNLLDQLNTHPVLLPTKPCSLSSEESYKIIREYVKKNIDTKVAKITSDYDFCLTVEKIIRLSEQEVYQVDINNSIFDKRKKKPKYETRYRANRQVKVFETAPQLRDGVYGKYPRTPEFKGESYEDLQDNIKEYLESLIAEINKPLKDCPHCKGLGVMEDK